MSRLLAASFVLLLAAPAAAAAGRQSALSSHDTISYDTTPVAPASVPASCSPGLEPRPMTLSCEPVGLGFGAGERQHESEGRVRPTGQQSAARTARSVIPLYVSFATLQALDVHSTLRAIDRGAVEENVLMQPFVDRPAAFIALKAGLTGAMIFADAHLSRKHRVAAFALMAVANGAYAAIVTHNYRVAAR